jgi:hypothetical protein
LHFFQTKLLESRGLQQGLGFLIKKGLVGRATTFADEEEVILGAIA